MTEKNKGRIPARNAARNALNRLQYSTMASTIVNCYLIPRRTMMINDYLASRRTECNWEGGLR